MCGSATSLQDRVLVISRFVLGFSILFCVSFIVYSVYNGEFELSEYLRWKDVGIVMNIFVSGVLFLAAITRSKTQLLIWLMLAPLQIIGFFSGMCYFAYKANRQRIKYNGYGPESFYERKRIHGNTIYFTKEDEKTEAALENILESRKYFIVCAVFFGLIVALLIYIFIIVKKFYNEVKNQQPCESRDEEDKNNFQQIP